MDDDGGIELKVRKPEKEVKNIEMLNFNGIWKVNNNNEYSRLKDKFKGYLDKIINNDDDIEQAVNDVLFLYIKCKCYDNDDYSTCWNKCLENYIIAKQIKSISDKWINIDDNIPIKFESNKYLSNDELIIKNQKNISNKYLFNYEYIIHRRYIRIKQKDIINKLYADILNDENYIINNKKTFILDLSDELNVLNNNIILHYFNEFIRKYFTDNVNSLPYRYTLIPDYAKISNDDDDDDDDNDNNYNDNIYNDIYIYNDVENWVIFIDLTSIVLKNIKKNRYGTAIYDIIKPGKFIGGVFDSSEGGKKSRKIRKPYKSRKNHKSHKTHKTRKSRKFRKYKTTRFRKSNKHGRLYNN